jgi:Xaa-Pro aminopeptidase
MDTTPYLDRRQRLLERMGSGIAVLTTAPERLRNRDNPYPYRADSYFQYLTGFTEPESALILIAGDQPKAILFCRARDADREIWDGYRYGPEAAREAFGFDEARTIDKLDETLAELLADQPALWHSVGFDADGDHRVATALTAVRAQSRAGKRAPAVIHDLRAALDDMRLIKDSHELALMRRAAAISVDAHRRAMQAAAAGRYEYELEADLIHEFRRQGSQSPAYGSIVAAGANACVLHYVANDHQMQDGELLLIDAGCELDGYAADITRTFPVNGRFSGAQRDVYQLVLSAQLAAIDAVRPGASFNAYHDAAARVLAQGMIDLGLIAGSLDTAIESGSYKRFYMHRCGHWLGSDVHDVGDYRVAANGSEWRTLATGMVLTVEPGCYIRPADDIPQHFWNIGVRIEDDVLVTSDGNEVYTDTAEKEITAIEALMAQRSQ